MRQVFPLPEPDIVHPTCARCGAPMWLIRIEPEEPGKQRQTFECKACDNSVQEIAAFKWSAFWFGCFAECPLWVTSGHVRRKSPCLLYTR